MSLCTGDDGGPPADEEGFRFACKFEDLKENKGIKASIGRKSVALFLTKVEGRTRVYALENACTHQGVPLHTGTLTVVENVAHAVCPGHGYRFNCKTGHSKESGGAFKQRVYQVKKKGTEVWIK